MRDFIEALVVSAAITATPFVILFIFISGFKKTSAVLAVAYMVFILWSVFSVILGYFHKSKRRKGEGR